MFARISYLFLFISMALCAHAYADKESVVLHKSKEMIQLERNFLLLESLAEITKERAVPLPIPHIKNKRISFRLPHELGTKITLTIEEIDVGDVRFEDTRFSHPTDEEPEIESLMRLDRAVIRARVSVQGARHTIENASISLTITSSRIPVKLEADGDDSEITLFPKNRREEASIGKVTLKVSPLPEHLQQTLKKLTSDQLARRALKEIKIPLAL